MNTSIFQAIKKKYNLVYIALIVGVLIYTFSISMQEGWHQTMPGPIGRHTVGMGIAISELKYGLTNYRGYSNVRRVFSKVAYDAAGNIKELTKIDRNTWNKAIKAALNINDASSGGFDSLSREDRGIITYYKLAFSIFGFKIESFVYLYFLLLAISVLTFMVTFYNRADLLNILLLFVCSHLLVLRAVPGVGEPLLSVHNSRFLPVLAILPAIYLALLIGREHKFTSERRIGAWIQSLILLLGIHVRTSTVYKLTYKMRIGAWIQTLILILVIHTRGAAIYQIMFLSLIFCLAILWDWINKPKGEKFVFNKPRIWPLALVFAGFFFLKLHLAASGIKMQHMFWHPAYLGLSAHPEAKNKYGIDYRDPTSFDLAKKRAQEQYGKHYGPDEYPDPSLTETILRNEYVTILKQDPRFVIEAYLYKFPQFFKNYFTSSRNDTVTIPALFNLGATRYLFNWGILGVIVLGSLLSYQVFLKQWTLYFGVFILEWSFSLLPPMLYRPFSHVIADPALVFTLIMYFAFSGMLCYVIKLFAHAKKQ